MRAGMAPDPSRDHSPANLEPPVNQRLAQQLEFISEIDKLKRILRMTRIMDGSRRENSAEHSWHIAVMAPLLAEYSPEPVNVERTMKMLLIHDVVEIDAGDTFCFDEAAHHDKEEREVRAAERLFGLLPDDQGAELRALWDEFELGESVDARFAVALDRLSGTLCNYANGGGTWVEHDVSNDRILERQSPIERGAPELWPVIRAMVTEVMGANAGEGG
jgi:5'-deoxynucleotidase YfbR-like HD superfamily hydrolase